MATLGEKSDLVEATTRPSQSSDPPSLPPTIVMTKDEYHLATLGYAQTFKRGLGLFENWAATFTTMNFVSGLPVLFGFAMYTGGPAAALCNWTMVGGLSTVVSLSLAEIAAAWPVSGGIYWWSYQLGGPRYGPFLSWMTAYWNWAGWIAVVPGVGQGATNFLIAALQIQYPDAAILSKSWFPWLLTSLGLLLCFVPNVYSQGALRWTLRATVATFFVLFFCYWIWFPVAVAQNGTFQGADVFSQFYNGINLDGVMHASDSYCWVVGILFGAWEFYGYDASVHLSEETTNASIVVARGMYTGTLTTWLMSIPTLLLILVCMQDFDGIISGTFANNWAVYCIQVIGQRGAVAILVLCWLDSILATAVCFMSAQRVTYAIARDGVLPRQLARVHTRTKMPINAGILVLILSVAVEAAIIGSLVAFTALTATATIAVNFSYCIPIIARHTVGREHFTPAKWNLGRWSRLCGGVATLYIFFLFVVLDLPQLWPVTADTLNYAPIMIIGISAISLVGWILPFGWGAMYWFKGPQRTISEQAVRDAKVEGEDEG